MGKMDYYKILQVDARAEPEVIESAYKRLANKYHPDHGGTNEQMAKLNDAYEVLGDPQKRAEYDRERGLTDTQNAASPNPNTNTQPPPNETETGSQGQSTNNRTEQEPAEDEERRPPGADCKEPVPPTKVVTIKRKPIRFIFGMLVACALIMVTVLFLVNSVSEDGDETLKMVFIPGGSFNMGRNIEYYDEHPVHTVDLSSFYMAKYEVTYAKWIEVKEWGLSHGYSFNRPGDMGSEDFGGTHDEKHPVTDIEWYDTVLWCNALSEIEGHTPCYYTSASQSTVYRSGRMDMENSWVKWEANGYRLPTEADWEYACRAGTTTEYSFGNSISDSDANYRNNPPSYNNETTPVGSYAANDWSLHDMHGNVAEWCWDWHGSYSSSAANNPKGPYTGSTRVVRTPSWYSAEDDCLSTSRASSYPDHADYATGFRPVCSQ